MRPTGSGSIFITATLYGTVNQFHHVIGSKGYATSFGRGRLHNPPARSCVSLRISSKSAKFAIVHRSPGPRVGQSGTCCARLLLHNLRNMKSLPRSSRSLCARSLAARVTCTRSLRCARSLVGERERRQKTPTLW